VIRRGSAGLVDIAERAVRGQAIDQEQVGLRTVKPMFDPPDGPRTFRYRRAGVHALSADPPTRLPAACPLLASS